MLLVSWFLQGQVQSRRVKCFDKRDPYYEVEERECEWVCARLRKGERQCRISKANGLQQQTAVCWALNTVLSTTWLLQWGCLTSSCNSTAHSSVHNVGRHDSESTIHQLWLASRSDFVSLSRECKVTKNKSSGFVMAKVIVWFLACLVYLKSVWILNITHCCSIFKHRLLSLFLSRDFLFLLFLVLFLLYGTEDLPLFLEKITEVEQVNAWQIAVLVDEAGEFKSLTRMRDSKRQSVHDGNQACSTITTPAKTFHPVVLF